MQVWSEVHPKVLLITGRYLAFDAFGIRLG
jgi:hypothetical protein